MTAGVTTAALAGWLGALRELVATPNGHRQEWVTREQALFVLRCPGAVLDRLLLEGLPCRREGDAVYFDPCDLTNLGLASGSGRSLPELAAIFVARLATAPVASLLDRREWDLAVMLRCPADPVCAGRDFSIRPPAPERLGGETLDWGRVDSADPGVGYGAAGRVATQGELRTVASPRIRRLFEDLVDGYRFRSLPASLEIDPDSTAALDGLDCGAAAVLLARELRREGFEARAQSGYLLGMIGVGDHAWLEVFDEDGHLKVLDCALPMVAGTVGDCGPGFRDLCCGSVLNRVLPFGCPAGEAIAEHRCDRVLVAPRVEVRVRPVRDGLAERALS